MPRYPGTYKRKNKAGGWTWYAYFNVDRRRVYVPGGYERAGDAAAAREDYRKKYQKSKTVDKDRVTVRGFAKIYLEKYGAGWKNSTFLSAESTIRNYVVKIIGNLRISEVTPEDIQSIINYIKRRRVSVFSSCNTISITKKMFEVAMHWGYIDRNPAYTVPVQKLPKKKQPGADWIQVVRMIEKINSPVDEAIIGCGFYGLLRSGETFALEWPVIDFELNVLFVKQRVYRGVIDTPKTESSLASVVMLKPLVTILKKWRIQSTSGKWVFPGRGSRAPMTPQSWYRDRYKPICDKFNLNITYHDLRHIGIQFLRDIGASPSFIQRQARHATIGTTFDIYSQIPLREIEENRERADRRLLDTIEKQDYKIIEEGE